MAFRVAAAQIAHETNVFSAVKTDLAAFEASGLHFGPAVIEIARDTNTEFCGFITGAEAQGFDLVPILAVWATPSGLITADTIEHVTGLLSDRLRRARAEGSLDGVLLALHGAMVTEIDDDGDGYILQIVREIVGPDVSVVATLDLHANISPRMVELADMLIGYDTYPHIDMAERGEEAYRNPGSTHARRDPPHAGTAQAADAPHLTTDDDRTHADAGADGTSARHRGGSAGYQRHDRWRVSPRGQS